MTSIASSEELLNDVAGLVVAVPITPPFAAVSNVHMFQTTMPTKAVTAIASIPIQLRSVSLNASERKRFTEEATVLKIFMVNRTYNQFKVGQPSFFIAFHDGEF